MTGFYTQLHIRLITDIAELYGPAAKQESRHDIRVIEQRVAREGISFLTKCLPKLAKAIDRSLSQGTKLTAPGFKTKPKSVIPKFLGWLLSLVFSDNGDELSNASPCAVRDLRQALYLTYKLEIPFTKEQAARVCSEFIETDASLPSIPPLGDSVLEHTKAFITNVFWNFNHRDILPRHGPGVVATKEQNHEKHCFKRIYSTIEAIYPFTEYFVYSMDQVAIDLQRITRDLKVLKHGTAKVVLVPKDSRGPRVISCEPLEFQWIQGGLGKAIVSHLESHPLTRGHVNFTCQEINRRLAVLGSLGLGQVTLDMKEASDRVSLELVRYLFADVPELRDALCAARSEETILPNGTVVRMKKFAPMGSSLCFPVEAIIFFALAVGTYLDAHYRPYRGRVSSDDKSRKTPYYRAMKMAAKRVWVYGDDIISNREDYPALLRTFPKYGLMFNSDKCCVEGSFRESCGMDAYKGVDVSPLRMKALLISGRKTQSPETYCSLVAFSNAAYARGLYRTARHVALAVESYLGRLPFTGTLAYHDSLQDLHKPLKSSKDDFGSLVWVRLDSPSNVPDTTLPVGKRRFDVGLQRVEFQVLQAKPRTTSTDVADWSLALRRLTSPTRSKAPGEFALMRSVTLKRIWQSIA